jgi:hypothetical protein
MRRADPRIRQTLNQIASNLETANESTQTALFSFTQNYLRPCFSSIGSCTAQCTGTCFPDREERLRRRGQARGRGAFNFDFYDDWDDDGSADAGLLGWGNDELDRLLAGSGSHTTDEQPRRKRAMSYGTRRDPEGRIPGARRKSALQPHDGGPDPTLMPSSSMFGFLERLPFKIGARGLRYKPSAADLQEHPGQMRLEPESEPLIEGSEDEDEVGRERTPKRKKTGRNRSSTTTSDGTTESFRSRGDLFPSEDEDDAQPLDDEFGLALERRTTGSGTEETGSAKTGRRKRPNASRTTSSKSVSSQETKASRTKPSRGNSTSDHPIQSAIDSSMTKVPSMKDLVEEEERVRLNEEQEIKRRRLIAQELAAKKGLAEVKEYPSDVVVQSEDVAEVDDSTPMQDSADVPIDPSIPSQLPDS